MAVEHRGSDNVPHPQPRAGSGQCHESQAREEARSENEDIGDASSGGFGRSSSGCGCRTLQPPSTYARSTELRSRDELIRTGGGLSISLLR